MSPKHGHSLCIVKVVKVRSYLECIRTGDLSKSVYEYHLHICFRSLFVLLKGASKEEAFRVGREITEKVTAMNPKPVKLKFEKVCIPSTASQLQ